ncbi:MULTISPECIES: M13 family metallopeptidase [unclassified Massilia]|uniref:M13 family metallopeptidase n=1 Tax=unclassified Massilia TaxID=2609279 RepID=UPI0017844F59|nr:MULTISPECIES: M13 family metallopeptidase [unclassified Massilia]MBD8529610.1 M13 family metallopeptidase [Massilia sp. CFBP 13647]MBD8673303.1 M13 family metallopeptidase [Massilia sp. CFBP 13721]
MKRTLCSTLIAGLFAVASHAGAADDHPKAAAAAATAAASGVDVKAIDNGVRAQDDFFRYSQGKWLKDVEIPADRASWGAFNDAQDKVEGQVQDIIAGAAADKKAKAGSGAQKMGDYYASYVDQARRDALGIQPLNAELARVKALKDKRGIASLAAHFSRIGAGAPLDMYVGQDNRDSTRLVVSVSQSGLGLPNRDYYLQDEARLKDIRDKYQVHVEKMLALAGHTDAAAKAAQVVALETEIARVQWSAVENRDPVKRYNKRSLAELKELMPGFDWSAWMKGTGVQGKVDSLIVSQPSYLAGLDKLIAGTPLEVWKPYFEFRLLSSYAPYLSKPFVDESFAFRGAVLAGTKENRAIDKLAIAQVNRDLAEIVGKEYVARHFPAERKQQVETMVKNFVIAFREGIETLDWMSPETKKQAQVKLSKMNAKIGYPDKWRDYSSLKIAKGDLVGNVMRAREFGHQYGIDKLGKPVDRLAWSMSPQTVNAYYSPTLNEVVFPAARLQYPLYDANAEPAINYGAVGISIGHEISHAFDDKGSQFDGDGNLRNWWTKEDAEKFAARGKVLVAQYGAYSPLAGYNVNGELTLGENIADNAGAIMASRAYAISLNGKPAPVIDGFTAEQRLFMGLAQARRGKARDAALISQVKSDPHSPSEFRVNGSMRNHPGFYEAYDVKAGDKMYLKPEERVIFW